MKIHLILACVQFCNVFSRHISSTYNPGCPEALCKKENINLVYSRSSALNDTLHYVITGGGKLGGLSILFVRSTGTNSKLSFNWPLLLNSDDFDDSSKPIVVQGGHVTYSYGIILTRIWQYDDKDDKADMGDIPNIASRWKMSESSEIIWQNTSETSDLQGNRIIFIADDITPENASSLVFKNGSRLSIRVSMSGDEKRDTQLPHNQLTETNMQMEFALDHMSPAFNSSRFAVEWAVVHQDGELSRQEVSETKNIDDEYTPGVFKTVKWVNHGGQQHKYAGYIQWKPVCYTTAERHLKSSTTVKRYSLSEETNRTAELVQGNVVSKWFGMLQVYTRLVNISFGLSKDGFYNSKNYMAWTATAGFGDPPSDKISLLLIMLILFGLGTPVVIISGGVIYIVTKRLRNNEVSPRNYAEIK